jgi:ribose 1,5-bisphosphokinase
MSARLIYVIGPSGAGKDSVLQGVRDTWANLPTAHWARRTITRAVQPGGEAHESVTQQAFDTLSQDGAFAMSWQANGLSYGIRKEELKPLFAGHCVFVNGSRAYLSQVLLQWPASTVVQISASADVLLQRLNSRNRESAQAVSERMNRRIANDLPLDAISIVNDGALQEAVQSLRSQLQVRLGNAMQHPS